MWPCGCRSTSPTTPRSAGPWTRPASIDAVVNNAAISGKGPLESFPLDRLGSMLETNTLGSLRLLQHLLPAWRARGSGVVVNISSVQGRVAHTARGSLRRLQVRPGGACRRRCTTSSATSGSGWW